MENLFQSNFNQLFDSAEIKELEASVPSVPCALTELQKQALVKAVLYVISHNCGLPEIVNASGNSGKPAPYYSHRKKACIEQISAVLVHLVAMAQNL